MEIFLSAGEASSDVHGAHLIAKLKSLLPQGTKLECFGLGGDRLCAQGMQPLMHAKGFLTAGGPLEVIMKLPLRRKLEKLLEKRLLEKRPDGAILIDNGEINLRLASLLHYFGVPVVYFIPPKVWVWRMGRLESIYHHVDHVLSILPFEKPVYDAWEIPFSYVGNPLIDEIPEHLSAAQAKEKLGLPSDALVLTVMPGSRIPEIRNHIPVFCKAVEIFLSKLPSAEREKVRVVMPVAPNLEKAQLEALLGNQSFPVQFVEDGEISAGHLCLRASHIGLVKSGTSTLEAALFGVPMVLAYQSSKTTEFLYKHLVRYRGFVGLVNLFLVHPSAAALGYEPGAVPIVPELILGKCTSENIAEELLQLFPKDSPKRLKMLDALSQTRTQVAPPKELNSLSPLEGAAKLCLHVFKQAGKNNHAE